MFHREPQLPKNNRKKNNRKEYLKGYKCNVENDDRAPALREGLGEGHGYRYTTMFPLIKLTTSTTSTVLRPADTQERQRGHRGPPGECASRYNLRTAAEGGPSRVNQTRR